MVLVVVRLAFGLGGRQPLLLLLNRRIGPRQGLRLSREPLQLHITQSNRSFQTLLYTLSAFDLCLSRRELLLQHYDADRISEMSRLSRVI
jgi:hypothetical protein